jgi:hypothetical protein
MTTTLLQLLLLSAAAFSAAGQKRPRMGLCVTGQLKRMEFWSKLHHFIVPNMEQYDMHVLFVLDPESIEAVNERKFLGLPTAVMGEEELKTQVNRQCPGCQVSVDFYRQPMLPSVARRYVMELDKFALNDTRSRVRRAVVHSRLFHSWSRCYRGLLHEPSQAKYDVFVRIREDLFIPKPVVVSPEMYQNAVAGMEWCGWGGLSDRMALLDARYGYEYFIGPFANMMMYYNEMRETHRVNNPETFFSSSLKFDGVPLRGLEVEAFPYFVTRRRTDGSMCFADELGKVGFHLQCIAPSVRRTFETYRCSGSGSLPDTESSLRLIQ